MGEDRTAGEVAAYALGRADERDAVLEFLRERSVYGSLQHLILAVPLHRGRELPHVSSLRGLLTRGWLPWSWRLASAGLAFTLGLAAGSPFVQAFFLTVGGGIVVLFLLWLVLGIGS